MSELMVTAGETILTSWASFAPMMTKYSLSISALLMVFIAELEVYPQICREVKSHVRDVSDACGTVPAKQF